MEIFTNLFIKLIPFYLMIFLGYIAGKKLQVQRESIAPLLIYIVNPVVFFHGILHLDFQVKSLLIPLALFCVSVIISFLYFNLAKLFWKDHSPNLIALAVSLGNVGYFGLPVAMMLFGEEALGFAVLVILGSVFYEQSIAFFIAASGKHSFSESLSRTVKLPTLYVVVLAILIKLLHVNTENLFFENLFSVSSKMVGAYSFLGMLMIGLGISKFREIEFNWDFWRFSSLALSGKFLIHPLLAFIFVFIDKNFLHWYEHIIHSIILLMSFAPVGANTITLSTNFALPVSRISFIVLFSTFIALFLIPLVHYFGVF
jgi:malate permease and related proteins